MGTSWFGGFFGLDTEEMARASKTKVDEGRVTAYATRLSAAKMDRAAFDAVLRDLEADGALTSAELAAVAHRYNKGGKKPASKAKALDLIRKRFVEIVRTANKNKIAEKARPW